MTFMRAGLVTVAIGVAVWLGAPAAAQGTGMNDLAERYVRLVLALGQHDTDYVDAYYGPAEWRTQAAAAKQPLADIARSASQLATAIAAAARRPHCGRVHAAAAPIPGAAARGLAGAGGHADRHAAQVR